MYLSVFGPLGRVPPDLHVQIDRLDEPPANGSEASVKHADSWMGGIGDS